MIYEYAGNLHTHTPYSDGYGHHNEIALAAINAGLDFVVITDHNIWVDGLDGYRYLGDQRVLLLTGEEIHDPNREPQKNHLLVYETFQEMTHLASKPQQLIDSANDVEGLTFLAHPLDPAAPIVGQPNLSWVDWEVDGYTGMEIWNFMSEFKSHLSSIPKILYYAYNFPLSAEGPFPEILERWDQLLASGKQVVAIGGSDAHATLIRKGPLKRVIFPYEWLFKAVNTHILTTEPLTGNAEKDRRILFQSMKRGRCFVGYDLPASTRGFRFSAQGNGAQVIMGESISAHFGITLQVKLPNRAEIRLLRNGEPIRQWKNSEAAAFTVTVPGAYRVEAHVFFKGKSRGWIYSNPIYVND